MPGQSQLRQHLTRIDSVKAAKAGEESVLQAGACSQLIELLINWVLLHPNHAHDAGY